MGVAAACKLTSGSFNIAIGCYTCLPIDDGSNQMALGCGVGSWIRGNANWNVGIGTTQNQGYSLYVEGGIYGSFTGDGAGEFLLSNLLIVVDSY